ncbi:CvpA family protein [Tannockella kyphosi]|uniref:CvpA family protein n=1 Tax=Tannockella kyphosi TaxID=2899121 RepID=UPI002011EDE4|nr:CvpA family protein [Tannockella kyphosi]
MFKMLFNLFKDANNNGENPFGSSEEKAPVLKPVAVWKIILGLLIFAMIAEYFMLIPITLQSPQFVFNLILLLVAFVFLNITFCKGTELLTKITVGVIATLGFYLVVGNIISLPIFHASDYQEQLYLDYDADFYEDNQTISYESIPVVDRDSATVLGDRKMGEIVDYVSQFEVSDDYNQINYMDTPYRVTPLEYADLIKWYTNKDEGLPAYITVDMVSQESSVVVLEEGMKYSESDLFGRNIYRYLRVNYPTLMFEDLMFEINEDGIPYYIAPVYEYEIGIFGGEDIVGAVLVNAVTGENQYYELMDVPTWVDNVYPTDLVATQLDNWGKYASGYLNAIFTQKGVLQQTDGYNYIALDGDVYYYTGLTSVSDDASNVGFALINMRTKEAKYYDISGAEEYSAMSSAEGQVQHLGYSATFPILVNAGGVPTYFLSLKDDAGLVKQYAFVSVENYQIVATGESVASAEAAYYQLLIDNGKNVEEEYELVELTGTIASLNEAVVSGNSTYYFTIEGSDTIYIADISLSDYLPLVKVGDVVCFEFVESDDSSEILSTFSVE